MVIGPDGAEGVVAGAERLVYSNVNGLVASAPGANKLYSDDVAIASKDGCGLLRYTYKVTGKALPDGTGGPFSVTSALYTSCPQSVGSTTRAQLLIQGTQQTFNSPDDAPREITVVAPRRHEHGFEHVVWSDLLASQRGRHRRVTRPRGILGRRD